MKQFNAKCAVGGVAEMLDVHEFTDRQLFVGNRVSERVDVRCLSTILSRRDVRRLHAALGRWLAKPAKKAKKR
jgi:hypothetical protein